MGIFELCQTVYSYYHTLKALMRPILFLQGQNSAILIVTGDLGAAELVAVQQEFHAWLVETRP